MRAIRIDGPGGSDRLHYVDHADPEPGPGQVLVAVEAAGVNFIDVYLRTGVYPTDFPNTPGSEAGGAIVALGDGVSGLMVGDRVAYTGVAGAYAELAVAPADRVVPVPDAIETASAAAVMLQGMTAHYLSRDTFPLRPGVACLVHAGAGGVGRLLIQMAKAAGATVAATVSTAAKADLAREAGADHVIRYTEVDFADAARDLLGERPFDVVYDSVGATTFLSGLDLLKPRGMMALYGQSSGKVPPTRAPTWSGGPAIYSAGWRRAIST
jgi:NADPH2:quinone reductase